MIQATTALFSKHGTKAAALLYVAPKFLGWAKELMTDIRASITKDLIDTLGEEAQKQAYEYVMTNSNQQATFCQKVKELTGKYDDKVVQSVLKRLVDYAFHARSNVEWQKYKKENTDRTASKEKKMGQREILKGGKKKGEP
jgi:UDP-glucose 6-dehydrogenase